MNPNTLQREFSGLFRIRSNKFSPNRESRQSCCSKCYKLCILTAAYRVDPTVNMSLKLIICTQMTVLVAVSVISAFLVVGYLVLHLGFCMFDINVVCVLCMDSRSMARQYEFCRW